VISIFIIVVFVFCYGVGSCGGGEDEDDDNNDDNYDDGDGGKDEEFTRRMRDMS
jgi:hypothetical protein